MGGLRLTVETKKLKATKMLKKTHRVPTCPLHAVLGNGNTLNDTMLQMNFLTCCPTIYFSHIPIRSKVSPCSYVC